jgi:hypothetical protein
MQLALFTSGAALWPVTRNFEAFIASLGAGAQSSALDRRLVRLHRDLYDALLRPGGTYAETEGCFAASFLPDLEGSPADALLEALLFYFLRRRRAEVSVAQGLGALRAVFFNHETSSPDLWVEAGFERLSAQRAGFPIFEQRCHAPFAAREQDLAFISVNGAGRPARSCGWVWGQLRRQPGGRVEARLCCGLDPSLEDPAALADARSALATELEDALYRAFGWARREAA